MAQQSRQHCYFVYFLESYRVCIVFRPLISMSDVNGCDGFVIVVSSSSGLLPYLNQLSSSGACLETETA